MIRAMARIEDYALLGDLQTAALVSTAGSIDWLCLPKFDSPACFAALLDTPDAGHWIVAPAGGGVCTRRRYVKDTLVLQTEWVSGDGASHRLHAAARSRPGRGADRRRRPWQRRDALRAQASV